MPEMSSGDTAGKGRGRELTLKPPTAAEIARVMSALGKRTSPAKKAASRENGKQPVKTGSRPRGRPKKPKR